MTASDLVLPSHLRSRPPETPDSRSETGPRHRVALRREPAHSVRVLTFNGPTSLSSQKHTGHQGTTRAGAKRTAGQRPQRLHRPQELRDASGEVASNGVPPLHHHYHYDNTTRVPPSRGSETTVLARRRHIHNVWYGNPGISRTLVHGVSSRGPSTR